MEPVIQYGETDWQFLKRLGSHLHIPLYADSLSKKRVLYLGMEKGIPLRQGVETCSVGISRKYHEVDHRKDNVARKEYVYHKVRSKENGQIGDLMETGSGAWAAVSDGKAVMFESSSRMELTAAGPVRLEAARIHAYTPQEINMFKSPAYCEEREKDIIPSGTRSNPPTGTGDAGFMLNYEFNAMSDVSILCGQEFTRYRPYNDDPEETELDLDGFCWEELLGNCLAGLAAVGTVTALAAYGASVVLTGGATAAFAPWVVGRLAGFCGMAAVGGMAINDYRRQEVSSLGSYALTGMTSSAEGAVAGAAFFMVPYASEVVMAQAAQYGMTGIMLPTGAFVSGETIMTAAMTTGYTMTGSNMLVKVNDSMAGLTRTNMMAGAMGQANYQLVKETSAQASNKVMEFGLSNPRLYGTNNNTQRKSGSIKSEETYKQHTDGTGVRNRKGQPVPVTEKNLDMALDPETYANTIAEKYGINLKGSGQDITIKYNPDLRPGTYGRTTAVNPNVIEIGPDALMSETELANTIAHELNHARDFIRGGIAPEPSAYSAGDALEDYINGGR